MRTRQSQSYLDYLTTQVFQTSFNRVKMRKKSDLEDGTTQPTWPRNVSLTVTPYRSLEKFNMSS